MIVVRSPPHKKWCLGCDTTVSGGEAPVSELWKVWTHPVTALTPKSTDMRC